VFQVVVQFDFFVDLGADLQQGDLFVALGFPFDAHHYAVFGLFCQFFEDGVFGEIDVLEAFLFAIVGADFDGEDELVEEFEEGLDVEVTGEAGVSAGDVGDEFLLEVEGFVCFFQFFELGFVLVGVPFRPSALLVDADLPQDVEYREDVLDFFVQFGVRTLLLLYVLLNLIRRKSR
jgi:hypothetical protein